MHIELNRCRFDSRSLEHATRDPQTSTHAAFKHGEVIVGESSTPFALSYSSSDLCTIREIFRVFPCSKTCCTTNNAKSMVKCRHRVGAYYLIYKTP